MRRFTFWYYDIKVSYLSSESLSKVQIYTSFFPPKQKVESFHLKVVFRYLSDLREDYIFLYMKKKKTSPPLLILSKIFNFWFFERLLDSVLRSSSPYISRHPIWLHRTILDCYRQKKVGTSFHSISYFVKFTVRKGSLKRISRRRWWSDKNLNQILYTK